MQWLILSVTEFVTAGVLHNCIKMAMSDRHRKLLITNRVNLIKDMQVDEELLSHLMGAGILTADMKEQIEVGVVFFL